MSWKVEISSCFYHFWPLFNIFKSLHRSLIHLTGYLFNAIHSCKQYHIYGQKSITQHKHEATLRRGPTTFTAAASLQETRKQVSWLEREPMSQIRKLARKSKRQSVINTPRGTGHYNYQVVERGKAWGPQEAATGAKIFAQNHRSPTTLFSPTLSRKCMCHFHIF